MFTAKTWKNRVSQYPNRFTSTDESGTSTVVTLERNNGEVSQTGDPFDEDTMNDLESRIASSLTDHDFVISTEWNVNTSYGDYSTYPYYQSIVSDLFTDESHPDCLVFGADPSSFMSETERDNKSYLCEEVMFTSSGITLLATDATEVELTLRVKGV